MRELVTKEKLKRLMKAIAQAAKSPGKIYFTGGTTCLFLGLREQTIDVDLKMDPEPEGAFEAIAGLKNELDLSIELASPADFIPVPANWREKSIHIDTIGEVSFYHFDLSLQALSKLERGHDQDLKDVRSYVELGFLKLEEIANRFEEIKPQLIRFPAIDASDYERKVREFVSNLK